MFGAFSSLASPRARLPAFTRTDLPTDACRPFWFYVDEFQNFTTLSFATMASKLPKFGAGLVLAHQYLEQLNCVRTGLRVLVAIDRMSAEQRAIW